jgi:hypothetical protein
LKIKRDWDPYMIDTGKGLGVLTSIIGKWDGTGQDQAKGRGKDRGPIESHQQGKSPIIVSRKGTGGNSRIHPIDLKMILGSWMQLS